MEYLTQEQTKELNLKPKGRYTFFLISEMMACTQRLELEVQELKNIDSYAQYTHLSQLVFKQKGKRKLLDIYLKSDCLIFEGWDLPFKIDTDTNSFMGNARFNFIADNKEQLIKEIQQKNLNKFCDLNMIEVKQ